MGINEKELQDWLKSLAADNSQYKVWYTLRKKTIQDAMSIGLEQKDYWKYIGRLEELKHLNQTATDLLKEETKSTKKPKSK
jgi:hypothetical protein